MVVCVLISVEVESVCALLAGQSIDKVSPSRRYETLSMLQGRTGLTPHSGHLQPFSLVTFAYSVLWGKCTYQLDVA